VRTVDVELTHPEAVSYVSPLFTMLRKFLAYGCFDFAYQQASC